MMERVEPSNPTSVDNISLQLQCFYSPLSLQASASAPTLVDLRLPKKPSSQVSRRQSVTFSISSAASEDPDGLDNPGWGDDFSDHESEMEMKVISAKRRGSVMTAGGAAVVIRDGDKSYRSGPQVLCGLDMTVPCGSIYGLLGSSGCGKTTVLSCIVGTRKLNRGYIWIFGQKPGSRSLGVPGKNIGYMPQETSLYEEFSIVETLNYFGTLCGMDSEELESKREFLVDLLDLPDPSRQICTLSGGQKRRVSFATALIHDPELLILDEPTAGVDPLLRIKIWTHLSKLVTIKRTTVIITTHYIEEARQALNIGIMRSGHLLAERPPSELLQEFHTNSLEEVVLGLCRKDTALKINPAELAQATANVARKRADEETGESPSKRLKQVCPDVPMAIILQEPNSSHRDCLKRIQALVVKNTRILMRNFILLLFVILAAAVLLAIICVALGKDPSNVPLGLINNELVDGTCPPNFTVIKGECNVEMLSCQYISFLSSRDTVTLRHYDTAEEAEAATRMGKIWGYIVFPENFSNEFYERSVSASNDPNIDSFNKSDIVVRMDESSKQVALPLKKALYDAFEDFIAAMLSNCEYDPRIGESVLKYGTPLFGRDDTDFREYITAGVGMSLIFFFSIIGTSTRYIKEKKLGVMDRSLVHGVRTWEVLAAYSISEFCILVIQSLLIFGVLTVIFQIKVLGSELLIFLIFILSGYGGIAMGFMLGTVCDEEISAALVAMAVFYPNFVLSGLFWPIEGGPVALQYISSALPCTLAGESTRSIISRGWEFTHSNVWPGFAVLTAYIIGYFALTIIFHIVIRR